MLLNDVSKTLTQIRIAQYREPRNMRVYEALHMLPSGVGRPYLLHGKKTSRLLANKSAHVASKYGHVLESYRCVPLQKCFNLTVTILMLSDLEAADSAV